ncbi:MAG: TniQ family protein, partial [Arenimonas sp.]
MDTSGSMARSGQSCVIPLRWPITIAPGDEEVLSSFLCRAAQLHGLSPSRFCHFYMPGMPVWNRDIDRTPPPGLLKTVARQAGLTSVEKIKQTTLSVSTKNKKGASAHTRLILHWITEVGIYHRLRTLHGQRFCPKCIQDRPFLLKHWRYSWCFCCTKHRILLQDACQQCGAVVALHRAYAPLC